MATHYHSIELKCINCQTNKTTQIATDDEKVSVNIGCKQCKEWEEFHLPRLVGGTTTGSAGKLVVLIRRIA